MSESKKVNHVEEYQKLEPGGPELINLLVEHHMGWATSIARSVARSWNLDWQIDGLDGGAYEGLLFCAGRYDPAMGVPFRAYARRRIHEASTEEARKSKAWQRGTGSDTPEEDAAREVSAKLLTVFPELRTGFLPNADGTGDQSVRSSIKALLASANVISAFNEQGRDNPHMAAEYNELLRSLMDMELIHQEILWGVYWQDMSMRKLAESWGIDELVVIREHREILKYISSAIAGSTGLKRLKIRPGLRPRALELKKNAKKSPFQSFLESVDSALILVVFTEILNRYTQIL